MTAVPSIDPALTKMLDPGEFLHEQLAEVSPDLMRELLATFVNALLGADADAVCGAAYNSRRHCCIEPLREAGTANLPAGCLTTSLEWRR